MQGGDGQLVGEIHVEVGVDLLIGTRVERRGRGRPQTRVHRVANVVVDLVVAIGVAHVVEEPGADVQEPAQAHHHSNVCAVAAKARHEPARKALDEGEAVVVRLYPRQDARIGQQTACCSERDAGRAIAAVVASEVADAHRGGGFGNDGTGEGVPRHVIRAHRHRVAVRRIDAGALEDARSARRVAEEEAAIHRALGVVAEGVEFRRGAELVGGVGEELHAVQDFGLPPDLRHLACDAVDADVGDFRVAGADEAGGVGALHGTDGAVGFAVFHR